MKDLSRLFLGLLIVVLIIVIGAKYFESFITEEIVQIKIKKIELVKNAPDEDYYLIHTDQEIFENRNNYFHPKQKSKKITDNFTIGQIYKVKVVGYNFGIDLPFFSKYRNIVEVTEKVKVEKKKLRRLN